MRLSGLSLEEPDDDLGKVPGEEDELREGDDGGPHGQAEPATDASWE